MVIAIGSYPIGRRFESHRRYHVAIRLCRAARFQGGAVHSLCAALPPQAGTAHPAENSFFSKSVRRLFEGKEISGPAPQISAENDRILRFTYIRPHGQAVKTSPFHGGNPGSSPGGVTKLELSEHHYYRTVGSDSFFIAVKGITWWMKEAECFNRSASILLCKRKPRDSRGVPGRLKPMK